MSFRAYSQRSDIITKIFVNYLNSSLRFSPPTFSSTPLTTNPFRHFQQFTLSIIPILIYGIRNYGSVQGTSRIVALEPRCLILQGK